MTMATLSDLARRLYDVVVRENQALREVDFARAGLLLPQKQACIDALSAARGEPLADQGLLAEHVSLLDRALEENRVLLERAMQVQTRILGLLAQAARPESPGHVGYGARGAYSRSESTTDAMAIRQRI